MKEEINKLAQMVREANAAWWVDLETGEPLDRNKARRASESESDSKSESTSGRHDVGRRTKDTNTHSHLVVARNVLCVAPQATDHRSHHVDPSDATCSYQPRPVRPTQPIDAVKEVVVVEVSPGNARERRRPRAAVVLAIDEKGGDADFVGQPGRQLPPARGRVEPIDDALPRVRHRALSSDSPYYSRAAPRAG